MRMTNDELKIFYENYKKPLNADGTMKLTKNYTVDELSDYRRIYNYKWRLKDENKEKVRVLALNWYNRLDDGGVYQKNLRINRTRNLN